MDKPKIFIHNIETGKEVCRDMTAAEIAELQIATNEDAPTTD
jgi:hypothetical protein